MKKISLFLVFVILFNGMVFGTGNEGPLSELTSNIDNRATYQNGNSAKYKF